MSCSKCASDKQTVFNGEVAIHFPGLKGLDKPIVWVFPSLRVCIACGLAQFIVPEAELEQLTEYGGPQGMQLVPKEF
jgi:hypothetical protein